MSASTVITDYVGRGLASARPTTPPIGSGALAFYLATDTGALSTWNGTTWVAVGAGGFDNNVTATGTNQSTAYLITKAKTRFSTVASGTGGRLPASPVAGDEYRLINSGSNNLKVYPDSTNTIDGGSSTLIVPATLALFLAISSTAWISL